MNSTRYLPALLLALLLPATLLAGDWPQFRGPFFNGSCDEKNLPTEFSETENVKWSVELPGPSASTPCIFGDYVFVSTTDLANKSCRAICLDRKSGRVLWDHETIKATEQDDRSTYSSPSPATDGKVVIFFYGTGDLMAFDFDGTQKWSQNIGPFAFLWTFSTSPLLYDGKLIMQVLQRDSAVSGRGKQGKNESFLLALDPDSGKTLWRQVRPSEAVSESLEAFTTPMPFEHEGRKELIVAGGDALTGHDPETGAELWRWATWNPDKIPHWRLVPSPVAGGGVVLVCAPKRDPVYAVKAGGKGTLPQAAVAWTSSEAREVTSDVPTPAFYDGDFFVLADVFRGNLARVSPDGKVKWSISLPGKEKYEASPLAADGKLYAINFAGEVSIVNAASGEVIRTIPMATDLGKGQVRSGIVAAHGNLFIRTNKKLFCIGK